MKMPVKRWSFKSQDPSIEHIGPMAQDLYAVFHVGESDTTVSTIDPPGIALAAVQGLNAVVKENRNLTARRLESLESESLRLDQHEELLQQQERELVALREQNSQLAARLVELESILFRATRGAPLVDK